ncbi:MAG TPA: gas vesicle protein [Trebonia sp.]
MQRYGSGSGVAAGGGRPPTNLGDILERVLDKGLVIAGDIQVNLLDIELLTIKLRLVIASLDTAREVGINWWESDPWLNAEAQRRATGKRARGEVDDGDDARELDSGDGARELRDEVRRLRDRITELESGQRE